MKHLLLITFIFSFLAINAQKKTYKTYDSISISKKDSIITYLEKSSKRKIDKQKPIIILYNLAFNETSNRLKYSLKKYSGQLFFYYDKQNTELSYGQINDYQELFSSTFFPLQYLKKGRLVIMPDGNIFVRYGAIHKDGILNYLKIHSEYNNSQKNLYEYYDAAGNKMSGLYFNLETKLHLKKFENRKNGKITQKILSYHTYEGSINSATETAISSQLININFDGLKKNEKNIIIYLHNNQYIYDSINHGHIKYGLKKTLKNEKNVFIIKNNNSPLNFKLKKAQIIEDKNLFFKDKIFNIENTYRSIFILLPDNSFKIYHGEIGSTAI